MTNVTVFPDSRTPEQHNDDQRRLVRERREIDAAYRAIPMLKGRQPEIVARNLSRLLEEAKCVAGVTPTAIAKRLWDGDTKPLYKLTLPDTGGPVRLEEHQIKLSARSKVLRRTTKKYVQVAEAIGEEVGDRPGWSREEVLVRLFRNSKIEQDFNAIIAARAASLTASADCWQKLSDQMYLLAEWVSKEAGLREHLSRISSLTGAYDLATAEIRSVEAGYLLPHGPLHGNFEVMEEFPPAPSALLFEEVLADVPATEITITYPGGQAERIPASVTLLREYRLAVGPAETREKPTAMIEIRSRVEVFAPGRRILLHRPWIFTPGWDTTATVDGQPATVDIDLGETAPDGRDWRSLLAGQDFNGPGRHLQPEHCYAAWRLATAEACEEMMARRIDDGAFRLPYQQRGEATLIPEGTVGASVELAMLAGPELKVEAELLKDAKRMVSVVEAYAALRRAQAMDMHDLATARWSRENSNPDPAGSDPEQPEGGK